MSTSQIALENLKVRRLPYWKLYKGSSKISQCDKEENPTANADEAYRQFEEELSTRLTAPGSYYVNVYRNINGEKGGFKYDFTITGNESTQHFNRPGAMSHEAIYIQAQRDLKIEMALDRIEKKIDAIGEFIASKATPDDKDDNEALKVIAGLFSQGMKNKAAAAAASPAIGKSSFASLG